MGNGLDGASQKAQFEPPYDVSHNLIIMEFQRNINEYTSFLVSRIPYEEVEKHLNEKIYSHEICDIIINILANVTSTSAYIYVGGEGNEHGQWNFVATGSRAINGEINIMSRLLIEILKEKVLLKIKVFHKSFSRRRMVAMIYRVQLSNIIVIMFSQLLSYR